MKAGSGWLVAVVAIAVGAAAGLVAARSRVAGARVPHQ